jgi:hypothetical protein
MNAGRTDVIDEIYAPDLAPAGHTPAIARARRRAAHRPTGAASVVHRFGSDDPADAADGVVLLF